MLALAVLFDDVDEKCGMSGMSARRGGRGNEADELG
jgi:hypothetical protein